MFIYVQDITSAGFMIVVRHEGTGSYSPKEAELPRVRCEPRGIYLKCQAALKSIYLQQSAIKVMMHLSL